MSDITVKCPHCLGEKPAAASVCMHCGRDRKGFGPRVRITSGARLGIGIFILLPLWIIGAVILLLIAVGIVKGLTGGKSGYVPFLKSSSLCATFPENCGERGSRIPVPDATALEHRASVSASLSRYLCRNRDIS